MEVKNKYFLIFSILFMVLSLVSVATATEVNAATASKKNLTDFAGLELAESQKYSGLVNKTVKEINSNEKEINNTRKKITDDDKKLVDKKKQLATKNKQLTSKNKQLKTYNNKLKKLNKKKKTKTVKKNIAKTKTTIKTIKKQITTYKKNIATLKKEITTLNTNIKTQNSNLKTKLSLNDTLNKRVPIELREGYKHLDYMAWALDIYNDYNMYLAVSFNNAQGEIPYDNRFDYGYYWQYTEAYQSYWYTQPPTFTSFMLGLY